MKTSDQGSGGWVSKPCPGQAGGPVLAGFSARQRILEGDAAA